MQCLGFSFQQLLQLWTTGSRHGGFSSCGSRALEPRCTGLAALRYMKSSRTRDQTRVPCIGKQILIHCTTREVLEFTSCDFLPLRVSHFFSLPATSPHSAALLLCDHSTTSQALSLLLGGEGHATIYLWFPLNSYHCYLKTKPKKKQTAKNLGKAIKSWQTQLPVSREIQYAHCRNTVGTNHVE